MNNGYKNKPLIGIVTVLYKSEQVLLEYLQCVSNQTFKNIVLYVVDNKSPDCSLDIAIDFSQQNDLKIVVIANDENFGVAKGNNIGINHALKDNCDLILLSNNDVVFSENTVEKLLEAFNYYKADMIVPKIYFYHNNSIWMAGGSFSKRAGTTIHHGCYCEDKGQFDKNELITYAPTCFMLINKTVFDDIGMMDENYFVYYDDTDFVYRATKNGKKLWYFSNVVVRHKEGTSTGVLSDFSVKYQNRNLVYFAMKNYSSFYGSYVIIYNLLQFIVKNWYNWPFSKFKLGIKSYFEGYKMFKSLKV